MSAIRHIDAHRASGVLLTTASGQLVHIHIELDADGNERLTVSGMNCDLDGDEPGTYVLVRE